MTSPRPHRFMPISPVLLALALLPALPGEETPPGGGSGKPPGTEVDAGAAVRAQAAYTEAYALFRQCRFAEAREQVERAVALDPGLEMAQELRQDVLAILGARENRLQMAGVYFKTLKMVDAQATAVRIQAQVESGDAKFARGDYAGAELDYDRAVVALQTFPYDFAQLDIKTAGVQVAGKRTEARAAATLQAEERRAKAQGEAIERARGEVSRQELALRQRVDELLRRAQDAFSRKDFKRAEVEAWTAYELDRRREDARSLYLNARREGHLQFEDRFEPERLERLARINEEAFRELIPQTEVLVYPEDWNRRAQRKPPEISSAKEEAWMAQLNARLEQPVSCDFKQATIDEVAEYFRKVTGVNLVLDPKIAAKTPAPVDLRAVDMTFRNALNHILRMTGLHMALQNEALIISADPISGSVSLQLYEVTDLIQVKRDFPGRDLALGSQTTGAGGAAGGGPLFGGGADAGATARPPLTVEDLVNFIKANVAAQSWTNPEVGIEPRANSTLFISQTPDVHRQIQAFLDNLRKQDLQVKVDIRILEVRKDYFEEIGIDWTGNPAQGQVLQNNGAAGYTRQNPSAIINGSIANSTGLPGNATGAAFTATSGSGLKGLTLWGTNSPFNFLNSDQFNAILNMVETESDLQQLSNPSIVCFNGQRANAAFLTQFAYVEGYDVVANNLDPRIRVLNFGDLIDIRPVVSADRRYITMDVAPMSRELVGSFQERLRAPRFGPGGQGNYDGYNGNPDGTAGSYLGDRTFPLELPNAQERSMRSSVRLPDRGSLLTGGYQRTLKQNVMSGVPFLSHIPFLGRLFSRTGSYDEERRQFYLLRTEIVNLAEQEAQR